MKIQPNTVTIFSHYYIINSNWLFLHIKRKQEIMILENLYKNNFWESKCNKDPNCGHKSSNKLLSIFPRIFFVRFILKPMHITNKVIKIQHRKIGKENSERNTKSFLQTIMYSHVYM